MAVRVEQLGRAFAAEHAHGFTAWTLATSDRLEAVLAPGYFRCCRAAAAGMARGPGGGR
jgi:hypothetical protein